MAAAFPRAPKKPDEAGRATEAASPLQYSLLLEYLVGEKRGPRPDFPPGVLGGFPAPVKSPEQKMVERAMESCGFKAALACVGGGCFPRGLEGRLHPPLPRWSARTTTSINLTPVIFQAAARGRKRGTSAFLCCPLAAVAGVAALIVPVLPQGSGVGEDDG